MTYRVISHAKADAETLGLPEKAFNAMIVKLAVIARDPYHPQATFATSDPQIRRASFGDTGLCSFHIDYGSRVVRVFDVIWVG